jgi:hypothetical protein
MLVAPAILTGCGGGGARSETSVQNISVTKGQQLLDLKRSFDAGIISKSEYERQRQAILDGS